MITVITGTPGAGKTLYAVSKLIKALIGTTIELEQPDGTMKTVERIVYTNINGLLLDHELIDGSDHGGIRNWHEWAKPGAVIVFDEFQKVFPPRANGSAVPPYVQALDTHRHMGVDFILMTQNVMNVDRHVHGLVNRHLHVRRIGNMRSAIVYEWDFCSRQLLYSKAISQKPWRYSKKDFALYKSAQVHTKQPRSIPTVMWMILGAAVATPLLAYSVKDRIQAKMHPPPVVAKGASTPFKVTPTASVTPLATRTAPALSQGRPVRAVGCMLVRDDCLCFGPAAEPMPREEAMCARLEDPRPPADLRGLPEPDLPVTDTERLALDRRSAADADVLAMMARRSERTGSRALR
ncbi:MAG: AAA family ATPase [Ramlibacter sp.]|nr:AAA family ATPase [Ramlibacter sp.]